MLVHVSERRDRRVGVPARKAGEECLRECLLCLLALLAGEGNRLVERLARRVLVASPGAKIRECHQRSGDAVAVPDGPADLERLLRELQRQVAVALFVGEHPETEQPVALPRARADLAAERERCLQRRPRAAAVPERVPGQAEADERAGLDVP